MGEGFSIPDSFACEWNQRGKLQLLDYQRKGVRWLLESWS